MKLRQFPKLYQKNNIKITLIIRPLKLHQKARLYDVEHRLYWLVNVILTLIRRVESVGITQEQNVFSVNPKSMLFQR